MLIRAVIVLASLAAGAPALGQSSRPPVPPAPTDASIGAPALGQNPPQLSSQAPTATTNTEPDAPASEPESSDDWVPATGARKLAVAHPPYPREIRQSLTYGRRLCRQEGGTSVTYPQGIVRTGDLTGDGRPDYIVDFRGSVCAGRSYLFTGTGGWDFEILVARPNGRLTPSSRGGSATTTLRMGRGHGA